MIRRHDRIVHRSLSPGPSATSSAAAVDAARSRNVPQISANPRAMCYRGMFNMGGVGYVLSSPERSQIGQVVRFIQEDIFKGIFNGKRQVGAVIGPRGG